MKLTNRFSHPFKPVTLAVAMALALASCGGGGGDGSSASAGTDANAAQTTPAGTPVANVPGGTQSLPCAGFITTGFSGDINAVYPDGWGGVPQTGTQNCGASAGGGFGEGVGSGGDSGGGGSGGGGSGGDGSGGGGSGSGGSGGGDGGAGAGGGEGKVISALMTVTRLSDGAVLGSALTDSMRGLVTIRPRASDGPVLLTLTGRSGAQYYDEGADRLVDFGPEQVLHALVDRFDENIGVSPLTESAYRYALNNFRSPTAGGTAVQAAGNLIGLTAEQVRAANEAVRIGVNATLEPQLRLASVKSLPTPVDSSSADNALPANRYGVAATVLGGLAKAAAKRRPEAAAPPALGITEQLARDLTDGKVDGAALDKSPAATAETAYYDASTLPKSLSKGASEMSDRFGKGTTNTITAPVATVAESDFTGQWSATLAAGSDPAAPNAAVANVALTVNTNGVVTGSLTGTGPGGRPVPLTGRVRDNGAIALTTTAGQAVNGVIQPDGTFEGTWADPAGNAGAWASAKPSLPATAAPVPSGVPATSPANTPSTTPATTPPSATPPATTPPSVTPPATTPPATTPPSTTPPATTPPATTPSVTTPPATTPPSVTPPATTPPATTPPATTPPVTTPPATTPSSTTPAETTPAATTPTATTPTATTPTATTPTATTPTATTPTETTTTPASAPVATADDVTSGSRPQRSPDAGPGSAGRANAVGNREDAVSAIANGDMGTLVTSAIA